MNKWLLIISIFSFSQHLAAKEMCTLARTMLAPAKNNRCFDQLISMTKNVHDRKWLLSIKNSWNPPKNLQMNLQGAGFQLYQGSKKVGEFQWLSFQPAIFSFNGKMKVANENVRKPFSQVIPQLLHGSSKAAAVFEAFFPSSYAADDADLTEKMAVIFSTDFYRDYRDKCGTECGTATEIMSSGYGWASYLVSTWKEKASQIKCTAQGVENIQQPLFDVEEIYRNQQDSKYDEDAKPSDDSKQSYESYILKRPLITINQVSKNEYEIVNLIRDSKKKVYATYLPSKNVLCTYAMSQALDEKYCDKAWNDFFKTEKGLEEEFRNSDYAHFDCNAFSVEQKNKCLNFFKKRFEKYDTEAEAELKICSDEACTSKIPLNEINYVEYRKFLNDHKLTTECGEMGCKLPEEIKKLVDLKQRKQGMLLQQETVKAGTSTTTRIFLDNNTYSIRYMLQTAKLMSECCKSSECIDVAFRNKIQALESLSPSATAQ